MEGKYLITTDNWFIAPDGKQYKSVWGDVKIVSDAILGIKTNTRSSNWFAKIGDEENHVIIAGCQIHYAVRCEQQPHTGKVVEWSDNGGILTEYLKPTSIYIASK